MGLFDIVNHFSNFTAPAAFVAIFTAFFARTVLPGKARLPGFRRLATYCFLAAFVALVAGLWSFGRDGKMASYAAMVLACATVPWVLSRGWRG
jgi:hypothetical protein